MAEATDSCFTVTYRMPTFVQRKRSIEGNPKKRPYLRHGRQKDRGTLTDAVSAADGSLMQFIMPRF